MLRLYALLLVACCVSGAIGRSLFGNFGHLRRTSQPDEVTKRASRVETSLARAGLLRLRGGAADGGKKDEKVNGVCIGIDLGTTYRLVTIGNSTFGKMATERLTSPLFPPFPLLAHLVNLKAVWLCGKMVE